MTISVLIVDDSLFYRTQLRRMIEKNSLFNVVAEAADGEQAYQLAMSLQPDVITMDYEMPILDGVASIQKILAERPIPILMLSSLTKARAPATLACLEAGAVDFLKKPDAYEGDNCETLIVENLYRRLITTARAKVKVISKAETVTAAVAVDAELEVSKEQKGRKVLLVGCSTGGPAALTRILAKLPKDFPLPVVVIQHMPKEFTAAFAERLDAISELDVKEARHGDDIRPGSVYIAPGGKQLLFANQQKIVIHQDQAGKAMHQPSVDVCFGSAAQYFGSQAHAIVLTGMGSDGCEGARVLKESGALVWAQDKESALVYGMPGAVVSANLADKVVTLAEMAQKLREIN